MPHRYFDFTSTLAFYPALAIVATIDYKLMSKLKAFADNKSNVIQNLKFVLGRVENIVGKGENAGYQHFVLFPQCFQKLSFSGSLKVRIVW